ncbi:MAG: hypothetical protein QW356_08610, partial [Candidatus Hadarchaeales archaeon]
LRDQNPKPREVIEMNQKARRIVGIHDVTLSGVSLEVTFRGVNLHGLCDEEVWEMLEDSRVEMDDLQVLRNGRDVVVVSPPFRDVERAREWLEKLTKAIKRGEEKVQKMKEGFSVLCGESEL